MPTTMTAGRPADADEIGSYEDIVTAHRGLCEKTVAGKGEAYTQAAHRVALLGRLYRVPDAVTDQMRVTAETALAAVRAGIPVNRSDRFVVADAWLEHLSLLVDAPTDGR